MNYQAHAYILGRLLQVEAALIAAPLLVSLIFQEGSLVFRSYLLALLLALALGSLLARRKPAAQNLKFYTRDGLTLAASTWLIYSLIGAIPLCLAGELPSYIDALFQIISGFTTTGASLIPEVEALSHASHFWLAFSHLVGGMGVLVFALALLPGLGPSSVNLMKAEVPGPSFGKLNSRLKDTARRLYFIYLGMTGFLVLALMLAGMNFFDALIHSFSIAGTGGISNRTLSIAYYDSLAIDLVCSVGMLLFAVNFNIYHYLLLSKGKERIKSEELRWFLALVGGATLLLSFNVLPQYLDQGQNYGRALRDAFFTSSSIISTTGFVTADFNSWPLFSHLILLSLMFVGGCAGSTAGGLKMSRVGILLKSSFQGVRSAFEPKRALPLRWEFQAVDEKETHRILQYFMTYVLIFVVCLALISLDQVNFGEAFGAVASCINNVGPAFGKFGPRFSYASLTPGSKLTLSLAMIAGRLEIYPLLMLGHTLTKQVKKSWQ